MKRLIVFIALLGLLIPSAAVAKDSKKVEVPPTCKESKKSECEKKEPPVKEPPVKEEPGPEPPVDKPPVEPEPEPTPEEPQNPQPEPETPSTPEVVTPEEPTVPVTPSVDKPRVIDCAYLKSVGAGIKWQRKFGCIKPLTCKDLKARGAGRKWYVKLKINYYECNVPKPKPGPVLPPVTG